MAAGNPVFTRRDLPYAGGVTVFIAFAIVSNYSGALNQPYASFTACGGVMGAFVLILGWIRSRNKVTWARKVPKQ